MAKTYKRERIYIEKEPKKEKSEINIPKEFQQLLPNGRAKQDWHAYHLAKTQEKRLFYNLLKELCEILEEPDIKSNGRPKAKISDLVFCLGIKLYSNYSGRKAYSDFIHAENAGFINKAPGVNTLNDFLNCAAFYDLLSKLITISAMPLKELEDSFSIDSSGFGNYQYERWQTAKYQNKRGWRNYLKGHIGIGTRTNTICSAEITPGNFSDVRQAPKIIETIGANFKIKEFSGDKAYNAKRVFELIDRLGGLPFIPFLKNRNPKEKNSPKAWMDMYKFFKEKSEEFMKHYHKRSNVETVFSMIKLRLGEHLKCRGYIAQRNELMMKFICHNICCLIQETFERGVKVNFKKCSKEYVGIEIEDEYPKGANRDAIS